MGPTGATGGRNQACVDIFVQVEDTRPPILLPPPPVNLISSDTDNSIDIGWAGVFDVADPEVTVTNDAPTTYPVGRTPVMWTATDSSGNSATGTQWVNVKSGNAPPVAISPEVVSAFSHDETRIDLQAFETEDTLDGRYDQLSFRIEDAPSDGFFVAPLFPFFIDDHRQHRINPDGTYTSYYSEAQAACTASGTQPDRTVIVDPVYVTVTDDDVMYVMDRYVICRTTGTPFTDARSRIARFVPDANGELQFASQFDIGQNPPGLFDRHLAIDHRGRLYVIPQGGANIYVLSPELDLVENIEARSLTKINPVTNRVEDAFPDQNRRLQSVAVSEQDVLYATDGGEVYAYDLTRRQPDNTNHYLRLPPVVGAPNFNEVDVTVVEPWASYHTIFTTGYADLVLDSSGDLYVSDGDTDRIFKFAGIELDEQRNVAEPSSFVGWLGKCNANLDTTLLACDTTQDRSIGFSCEDDTCGTTQGDSGSGRGQFSNQTGIAMSPQDVLYVTDTGNFRVQRFSTDGFFAGEAVSECQGGCFVLGDFGFVTNVAVNSNYFYLLDTDNDLTHIFETTPVSDIDDQTMSQTQTAYVTYKSKNNYIGDDSFSFIAYDGLEYSNEAVVDIAVGRNFRPPIATPGLTFSGDEDTDIPLAFSGLDPDEDMLAFEIDTPPANGTITELNGEFTYTPDPDFFGVDQFTFVANDSPSSVPVMTSAPEVVQVTVAPVNDAPVISTEPLEVAPLVYDTQIEALLEDVDLDDVHRVAIDWGDGTISDSRSSRITLGASPGMVRILAEHAYQSPSDPNNPNDIVLTICASDAPTSAPLTCASPDVTATLAMPITVEPMVDLRIDIDDDRPKSPDSEIPEIMISDPLLDGGTPVTYTLEVLNIVPTDSDFRPASTDTRVTIAVPTEMALQSVTASAGSCTTSGQAIDCVLGDIAPDTSVIIDVTAAGSGVLIADRHVTLQAEATATERNVGMQNAGSWDTKLLLNGDLDPDGDGVPNRNDAFPGDPLESVDTDMDGIGNNADLDDDNDSMPDRYEDRYGLDKLDASDRTGDLDGDGLTNEMERLSKTRPDVADSDRDGIDDVADNCPLTVNVNQFDTNGDALGDVCDARSRSAATAIGDADGDGVQDIALLKSVGGTSTVYSKSAESDFDIAVFDILTSPHQAETLLGVTTSGGEQAVAMVYSDDTGASHVTIHNAWTGAAIADVQLFDNTFEFIDAAASGNALIVMTQDASGAVHVSRRDAGDGSSLGETAFFGGLVDPIPLAIVGVGADSAVVLADDGTGVLIAETRSSVDGSLIGEHVVPSVDWLSTKIAAMNDGFVTVTTNADGSSTGNMFSLQQITPDLTFDVLANGVSAFDLAVGSGPAGTAAILVAATALDGSIEVWSYDSLTGIELDRIAFLSTNTAPRALTLGGDVAGTASRVGVLASDANGDVSMEQRDAITGTRFETLTAQSNTAPPPSPPPAPPPPPNPGGGGSGGGGSTGIWFVLAMFAVLALRGGTRGPRCRRRAVG